MQIQHNRRYKYTCNQNTGGYFLEQYDSPDDKGYSSNARSEPS